MESCVIGRPSLGITLLFATFGFGADRFYVAQPVLGVVLLISYLTIFGSIVAVPVEWLSSLSLVFAILGNRRMAFMYGNDVMFEYPTMFDKVIAILWILLQLILMGIILGVIIMGVR